MTTARELCQRALEVIGAVDLGDTAGGDEAAAALTHLNSMMHALNTRGAVVEWSDKDLSDTVPFEKDIEDLVVHALANRLQVPMGEFPTDRDLSRRLESAEGRLAGRYKPAREDGDEFF